MSSHLSGQADLDAERAEPGAPASAATDALADDRCTVVAVRTDGKGAIVRGLPDGVDAAALVAPVVLAGPDDDAGPIVAITLDMAADTELIARFGRFQDPRMALIGESDPHRLLGAIGYANWRAASRFCTRDGGMLTPRPDGRAQHCDRCGREVFPRLEPAVIMRVTDEQDRILLGRQPSWPRHRYSVLAGFVDPGESIEDAVRREVAEEVGLALSEVRYEASQAWPFPASIMLGYGAVAASTEVALDDEIAEAHWFARDELRAAMDRGEAFLPPDVSIAHTLTMSWLGEDTPITTWYDQM